MADPRRLIAAAQPLADLTCRSVDPIRTRRLIEVPALIVEIGP
jgi:hypothetical protein